MIQFDYFSSTVVIELEERNYFPLLYLSRCSPLHNVSVIPEKYWSQHCIVRLIRIFINEINENLFFHKV